MHLKGYGCAGRSAVDYGLAGELEAGESGKHGAEEQKQQEEGAPSSERVGAGRKIMIYRRRWHNS